MNAEQLKQLIQLTAEIKECPVSDCIKCKLNAELIESTLKTALTDISGDAFETIIAPFKGIEYNIYGLGRHRISYQVTDGAINPRCTFQREKINNVYAFKPRTHIRIW